MIQIITMKLNSVTAVGIIVTQLEIYDQVWVARECGSRCSKSEGGVIS